MKELTGILDRIINANHRYRILKLSNVIEQSEILRDLSCAYSDLTLLKEQYRDEWLDAYNAETGSNAKKERSADSSVREYDKVKDVLRATELQIQVVRSTISANKKQE